MMQSTINDCYQDGDSFIHKLDPRTKILSVFFVSILTYFISDIKVYIFFLCAFFVSVIISRISVYLLLKNLKPVLVFLLITYYFYIFFTPSDVNAVSFIGVNISHKGIEMGTLVVARIISLVLFSTLITITTKLTLLITGIEKMLKFLSVFRINTRSISVMLGLSVSFIPLLILKISKIVKKIEKKNIFHSKSKYKNKIKKYTLLIRFTWYSVNQYIKDLTIADTILHNNNPLAFGWRDFLVFISLPLLLFV